MKLLSKTKRNQQNGRNHLRQHAPIARPKHGISMEKHMIFFTCVHKMAK